MAGTVSGLIVAAMLLVGCKCDPPATVITNPNFGSALVPVGKLINSGSVWIHSFQIMDPFVDVIPAALREDMTSAHRGCEEIAASISAATYPGQDPDDKTLDQLLAVNEKLCQEILQVTKNFNDQKDLLISEIDDNVMSIRHAAYSKPELREATRTRVRRAPLEFISKAGEKIFGIGRKKHIKELEKNLKRLEEHQEGINLEVIGNMNTLHSVNVLQNEVIGNMTEELEEQSKDIKHLVRTLNVTQEMTEVLIRKSLTMVGYLYNVMSHQQVLQSHISDITLTTINTLTLLRIKTGELKSAMQKIASGVLPNELVPSQILVETLEELDDKLLRKRSQFMIAMRQNSNYYYGMPITSFG